MNYDMVEMIMLTVLGALAVWILISAIFGGKSDE
jgi:hypothetical protein